MDQLQKVKVVARIRQSNISETYSSAPQQAANINSSQVSGSQFGGAKNAGDNVSMAPTQVGSPKSILINGVQGLVANSSLDKDGKVCIFTASSTKEKPIYVAASGNPIKKQLLTEYVKSDKNIIQYRHSILENANIFKFDHAMSYKINNDQLYKYQCQDLVQKAMSQGISSTFVVVGPAKAGKKFTIKGGEQTEKGILTRTVDDMIKLSDLQSQSAGTKVTQRNKPVTVVFSIFAIYNNEVVDLLQKDPNEEELEEIELTFSGEFRKYFMKSRERLKSIGNGEQSIRRLHTIYKFSVYRNETGKSKSRVFNGPNGGLFSTVTIVHCADFSKAKMPEFVILGDYLTDIATRKDANIMEVPAYTNSKLINHVNDSLNSGKDNQCVLLCNISGAYDYLSQSVDCLQFCAGIKERIDHYFEDVNAFNQDQDMINQLASPGKSLELQQGTSLSRRGNSGAYGQGGEIGGTFRNSQEGFNGKQGGELIHIPQRDATFQFRRQRGENPSGGEIQQDLSNLMKDIYSFTDQTNGLSEEEIKDWALDREAELKSIQNDISKLSPEEQRQFEAAQFKINESLNFLQQIKKNALQLSQSRSPTSGAIRMSDDLGTLMSQYNKSRESVMGGPNSQGELARSYTQSMHNDQQEGANNQSYTYQNNQQGGGGKKSIQELREQILNKIEEVINENDASRRTVRMGRNGESVGFNADGSSRNLRQLKELLADQDFLIQEKRQKLKQKNKELKEQQVEMRNQLQYLEDDVKEKDAKVQYLQDQQEQLKDQIERDRDIIQLKIDKEELLEKNDEELRELIDRLKIKLQRRKEECLMLKDNIDKVEREIYQERIHFEDERNSLVRQVNEMTNAFEDERIRNQDIERINENLDYQVENQERLIKKLQEDLDLANKRYENVELMYQEEQGINKELRITQTINEKRIDEAEDRAQVLEVKLNKLKKRFQEERNLLAEEKDQELIRKKETTARLKNEVRDLEKRVQELTQDSKIIKAENIKLQQFNDEVSREASGKSRQVKDLSDELENVQQELKRVRNVQRENAQYSSNEQLERKKLIEENDRLSLQLRKADTNIHTLEKELQDKTLYIEGLKRDFLMIDQESNGQKDFINKLERQNQYLSDVQHSDIDRLESKIKQLNQEVTVLRRENQELKARDNQQQLNLSEFKIISDKQNEKLHKNKNVIKHLTTQLDSMDEKVKELIHDKNLEISQVHQSSMSYHPHNASRVNDSLTKNAQANYRNAASQQRSILKKPRFNLVDSDSDDSDEDL